jgi:transposase-like protein
VSKTTSKFCREVRERSVRLVLDNQGQHGSRWQAVLSICLKIGCEPQTLNDGVNKAEVIHRRGPWPSVEVVAYATLEWVDWFNNRRLLEPIGTIPPAKAEANDHAAPETEANAA